MVCYNFGVTFGSGDNARKELICCPTSDFVAVSIAVGARYPDEVLTSIQYLGEVTVLGSVVDFE